MKIKAVTDEGAVATEWGVAKDAIITERTATTNTHMNISDKRYISKSKEEVLQILNYYEMHRGTSRRSTRDVGKTRRGARPRKERPTAQGRSHKTSDDRSDLDIKIFGGHDVRLRDH